MRPVCRLLDAHAELLCDPLLDDRARPAGVELQRAADQMRRIDITQRDIGVGYGRLGAALAITYRPRRGAGAVRTDLQRAAAVDPQDRAAAGTDLGEIDRRHLQCIAGSREQPRTEYDAGPDLVLRGAGEFA